MGRAITFFFFPFSLFPGWDENEEGRGGGYVCKVFLIPVISGYAATV